jgi:hypothetical protein
VKHSYDDDRLEEEFGRLRSETEGSARVPDFGAMLEKAKADAAERPDLQVIQGGQADAGQPDAGSRRRRVLQIGGWASAAVAAAVAGVLLMGGPSDADREFERLVASYTTDLSAGAWSSPTAALMNVPGMNLTRSVPSFGTTIRGLDPSQRPNAPEPETRDL